MLSDLHRHLDGSLRPATLEALAAERGLLVPDLVFSDGIGLSRALSSFAFTLSLLDTEDAIARVASEVCEDAAAEGVTTLEIRFAPQLHHGVHWEAAIDAALSGAGGRAGIILCGLYGEPPDVLLTLVQAGAQRKGVVGIDLAGGPAPCHAFQLQDYQGAFQRAEAAGLGRTVHAGEGRSSAEIRIAVEVLRAQRIGHGTTLLEDPAVVDLVLRRDVTIEACLTSNVHTSAILSLAEHPLPKWLDLGVRACICTDNTLLSGTDAAEELRRAGTIPGMGAEKLRAAVRFGHEAAFRRN